MERTPNISVENKKSEAVARMKSLGIFSQTVSQFERDGLVSISEPPFGAFYWAEGDDLRRVRDFEASHNAVVYMVVRSYTEDGRMDSFLYVSDYPDEWETDRADLTHGETLAYVYNHDAPEYSELGYIGIALTPAAGLRRVW